MRKSARDAVCTASSRAPVAAASRAGETGGCPNKGMGKSVRGFCQIQARVLALPDRVVAAADRALDVGQQHVDVNPLLGTQRAPRTSQAARPPPVSSTVCACPASAKRRKQNKPSLKTSASGARWRARQSLMLSSSKLRTGSMTACTGCSSVSSVSTAIPRRGLMSGRPACSPSRAAACRRCIRRPDTRRRSARNR